MNFSIGEIEGHLGVLCEMPYETYKKVFSLSPFTEHAIEHFPGYESYYPGTKNVVKETIQFVVEFESQT